MAVTLIPNMNSVYKTNIKIISFIKLNYHVFITYMTQYLNIPITFVSRKDNTD